MNQNPDPRRSLLGRNNKCALEVLCLFSLLVCDLLCRGNNPCISLIDLVHKFRLPHSTLCLEIGKLDRSGGIVFSFSNSTTKDRFYNSFIHGVGTGISPFKLSLM